MSHFFTEVDILTTDRTKNRYAFFSINIVDKRVPNRSSIFCWQGIVIFGKKLIPATNCC